MSQPSTRRVSLDLPADLVDALTDAATERVVGRALLMEHILRDGLERLVPIEDLVRRRSDL